MQKIKIVAVGNIKEKYFSEAIVEYKKRLSRFCDFEIVEVLEYNKSEKISEQIIKEKEGEFILKNLTGYVIALDLGGKEVSSEDMATLIKSRSIESDSRITFVIGGSFGLSKDVLERADAKIRFGKITFPHQLIRVVLSEQVYRSFTILNNVKYHK
jgi:23S rRNA (pseudouridine1915-N3)-methyltransferase